MNIYQCNAIRLLKRPPFSIIEKNKRNDFPTFLRAKKLSEQSLNAKQKNKQVYKPKQIRFWLLPKKGKTHNLRLNSGCC